MYVCVCVCAPCVVNWRQFNARNVATRVALQGALWHVLVRHTPIDTAVAWNFVELAQKFCYSLFPLKTNIFISLPEKSDLLVYLDRGEQKRALYGRAGLVVDPSKCWKSLHKFQTAAFVKVDLELLRKFPSGDPISAVLTF